MTGTITNSPEGYVHKGNRRLTSIDDWHRFAPPKHEIHWKDGRSAKESARAWIAAAPRMQPDIERTIAACPDVGPLHRWRAEPEARVAIDTFRGEQPNIDVLLVAKDERGPVVVVIEAKADETFGDQLADRYRSAKAARVANPRSRALDRIEALLDLFHLDLGQPRVPQLRYQLFTAVAAALAEAERCSSDRAFFVVHEFVTSLTRSDRRERNGADLDSFLSIALDSDARLDDGEIAGPFLNQEGLSLFLGKVRTLA